MRGAGCAAVVALVASALSAQAPRVPTARLPDRPFHDAGSAADVFWGPSIHWNTYLEQYVMLVNRARDDTGSTWTARTPRSRPTLADPGAWSAPQRIIAGGGWYGQVAGLEPGSGTDRLAGQRARFFQLGVSQHYIEFAR